MADEVKLRTPAPQPLPAGEIFNPGREPGPEAHPPEDDFWQNIFYEDNQYKFDHYRASAQALANEKGCAVLLYYYTLPNFQQTNGTMMAAFIPGEENMAA